MIEAYIIPLIGNAVIATMFLAFYIIRKEDYTLYWAIAHIAAAFAFLTGRAVLEPNPAVWIAILSSVSVAIMPVFFGAGILNYQSFKIRFVPVFFACLTFTLILLFCSISSPRLALFLGAYAMAIAMFWLAIIFFKKNIYYKIFATLFLVRSVLVFLIYPRILTEGSAFFANTNLIAPAILNIFSGLCLLFISYIQASNSGNQNKYPRINLSPEPMIIINSKGLIVECNDVFLLHYDFLRENLVGTLVYDFLDSNSGTETFEKIKITAKEGISFESKHSKNNNIFVLEISPVFVSVKSEDHFLLGIKDITSRKNVEASLVERNLFIESILNLTPDIIYIFDLYEQKNVYSNKGIESVLGYTSQEIHEIGSGLLEKLMFPEDFQNYISEILPRYRSAKDKEYIEHQYRMKHKDGHYCWLHSKEQIYLRNPDLSPRQIFGITQDVSERKKDEFRLAENESNLVAIIENTTDSILTIDRDYKIIYMNQVLSDSFFQGFGKRPISGKSILEFVPEPLRSVWKSRYDEVFENKRLLLEDGIELGSQKLFFELSMNPILEKGRVTGASIFSRNITDRKLSQHALIESEERFKILASLGNEGIMIHEKGEILECNQAFITLLGYTKPEEIIGKNAFEIIQFTKDSKERVIEYLRLDSDDTYDIELLNLKGDIVFAMTRGTDILYKDKRVRLVLMYDVTKRKQAEKEIKDLNTNLEQKVAERTNSLTELNRKLESSLVEVKAAQERVLLSEKLATLGQLAAGMTHELNTPLAAIVSSNQGILDLLEQDMKMIPDFLSSLNSEDVFRFKRILDESLRDTLPLDSSSERVKKKELILSFKNSSISNFEELIDDVMNTGAYRLGESLKELLNTEKSEGILSAVSTFTVISRLSYIISVATERATHVVKALKNYLVSGTEDSTESMVPIDIIFEIETILTLYQSKIKYGIEMIKSFETSDLAIGNANMLNQIWINLLNNGLQAMNFIGKFEIHIERKKDWIITSFIDSGEGIPTEIQDKIFDPFFTTKKHGAGIGLGLDICKKLITIMGGEIQFESAPGRTKFSVFLKAA